MVVPPKASVAQDDEARGAEALKDVFPERSTFRPPVVPEDFEPVRTRALFQPAKPHQASTDGLELRDRMRLAAQQQQIVQHHRDSHLPRPPHHIQAPPIAGEVTISNPHRQLFPDAVRQPQHPLPPTRPTAVVPVTARSITARVLEPALQCPPASALHRALPLTKREEAALEKAAAAPLTARPPASESRHHLVRETYKRVRDLIGQRHCSQAAAATTTGAVARTAAARAAGAAGDQDPSRALCGFHDGDATALRPEACHPHGARSAA
jgi:hypothetical protein